MNYSTKSSKTIFQGRVFDIRQDEVSLPDGRLARIDLIIHRDAVAIIPIDDNNLVLFIRQYRHATQKLLLELPAGVIEPGESPEMCASREIREETGMQAGYLSKLGGFYLAPGYSTEYLHVFLAKELRPGSLEADDDEIIQVEKIPFNQAIHLAESAEIEDAKTLAALLLARPLIQSVEE